MIYPSSIFLDILDDPEVDIVDFIVALIELDPENFIFEESDQPVHKKCRITKNRCKDLWTSGWGRIVTSEPAVSKNQLRR